MKKFKSLLRENYHIVVLSVMLAAVFYVVAHVWFILDDAVYRQVAVCDWSEILWFMKWHLMTMNGRTLVHFFAILFLRNNWRLEVWRFLCTFAFCAVPLLCAKISAEGRKISRSAVLLIIFLMTSTYPYIWDSSVYWLAGSFNYLFPSVMLLVIILIHTKKPDSLWLIPLSFFCGATTDQVGIMTIGFFVLVILDRIINRQKITLRSVLFFLSSCAGYAMIMICPGTYKRFTNQGGMDIRGFSYNLFKLVRIRWIDNLCIATFTVCITLIVIFWLYKFKNQNSFTKKANPVLAVLLAVLTAANLLLKARIVAAKLMHQPVTFSESLNKAIIIIWLIYAAIFIGSIMLSGLYIYIFSKKAMPLICLILAMGSQFMMAVSDMSLSRTCVPGLFAFYVFMTYSVGEFLKSGIIKNVKLKPLLKAGFVGLCIVSCAFQVVTGLHCVFKSEPYNPKPLSHEEMVQYTDKLLEKNIKFYSGEDWHESIDAFDFSKLYF